MDKLKRFLLVLLVVVIVSAPFVVVMIYLADDIDSLDDSSGAVSDVVLCDTVVTSAVITGSPICFETYRYNFSSSMFNNFYCMVHCYIFSDENDFGLTFSFDYGFDEESDGYSVKKNLSFPFDITIPFRENTYSVRFLCSAGITDLSEFDCVRFGYNADFVIVNNNVGHHTFEISYISSVDPDLYITYLFMSSINMENFSLRTYYLNNAFSNSDGYSQGYNAGYDSGVSAGQTIGYNNGYSVGNKVGYQNGYNVGVADGGNYSFLGLIGAVVDAPINAFISLLNFEVFGFNMLSLITGLFTFAIVLVVARLILGKGSGG